MTTQTKQAFLTALAQTHGHRLRRYLAARLRNARSDLADVTQEVYLRLLRIDDHEAIRNPQAYLFTVASHVLHQHGLRQAASPLCEEMMDAAIELQNGADTDPSVWLETEQQFEAIGAALFAHSPRAYTTLVLHRRDGLSLQEIAGQFGVSYRMVKRYLATALLFLQQQIDERKEEAR